MNNLNKFMQVLLDLNIQEEQLEDILEKNPAIIDGNYDEFVINIDLLHKAKVPYNNIGELIVQNANFLFYDSNDLIKTIKSLLTKGNLAFCTISSPILL